MDVLDKFCISRMFLQFLSMVFGFSGFLISLIFIKKYKFYYYASRMYKGDFSDKAWAIKLYKYYISEEVISLFWWLPVCLVLDITLRNLMLPSIKKVQRTVQSGTLDS
jgi:hypothetical protein